MTGFACAVAASASTRPSASAVAGGLTRAV
jgi:hypothetical protein